MQNSRNSLQNQKARKVGPLWVFFAAIVVSPPSLAQPGSDLKRPASWELPAAEHIRSQIIVWARDLELSPAARETLGHQLQNELFVDGESVLQSLRKMFQGIDPQLDAILPPQLSENGALDETILRKIERLAPDPFVARHIRLLWMEWLIDRQLYDEALELSHGLQPAQVLDPVTLLYSRMVASHQIADRETCLNAAEQLLEHRDELPRRVRVLAELVRADVQALEVDSLDEVSRLMHDIQRRQGLHRAGRKVLDQEQVVLEKLDRLIDQAEKARRQSAQQNSGGAPSRPLEDSRNVGGLGSGDVARKNLPEGGSWGNLPPAERAAALAELTREMPPHYRPVIEEYFRRLAQQQNQDR